MKLIFAGTPDFAVVSLNALIQAGHEIVAVYTQPDRPAGRGRQLMPSPVKVRALQLGLCVKQPLNFKDPESQAELAALNADAMIVVAYGLILPQVILDTPKLGCLNVHASLLPRWRGAAPIQRALLAGDVMTGVGIMQMAAGLDTGDLWHELHAPIYPDDTSQTLHNRLALLGAEALVEALPMLHDGAHKPTPQSGEPIYAHKLTKAEARLDWTQDARLLARQIRGYNPFPVAWASLDGEVTVRIYEAESLDWADGGEEMGLILAANADGIDVATGRGVLRIHCLQWPGGRVLTAAEANAGHQLLARMFM